MIRSFWFSLLLSEPQTLGFTELSVVGSVESRESLCGFASGLPPLRTQISQVC